MVEEADRRNLADPNCGYGWQATAIGNGKHAGFHIWAAYSYSPNASWGQLAAEFLESKINSETLKTFINTVLGELWEPEISQKLGAEGLKARAETFIPNIVPMGGLALVAGVDVQDNRFAISLYSFGRGEEAWSVNHMEIFGDPGQPEIWKQLDSVLLATYRHECGAELKVSFTLIDSGGHFTHETYAYCRARKNKRVFASKGASVKGKPIISKPTKQDINYRGQVLKHGVDLYSIGADTAKSLIYGRLKHNKPGPGFIHLCLAFGDSFFAQITAERQVVKYDRGGFQYREWTLKPGDRNEALDCIVLAFACLELLYTRFNRNTIWDQLEKRLKESAPAAEKKPESDELPAEIPGSLPDVKENEEPAIEMPAEKAVLKKLINKRTISLNRRPRGFLSSW